MTELYEISKPIITDNKIEKAFISPQEMLDRLCDYFAWAAGNPLNKKKFEKDFKKFTIPRGEQPTEKTEETKSTVINCRRALSPAGACAFLRISIQDWHKYGPASEYSKNPFEHILLWAKNVIEAENYSDARAGKYNHDDQGEST